LEWYQKRYTHQLEALKHDINILKKKILFIESILDKSIDIFADSPEQIRKHLKITQEECDQFMNMRIQSLTKHKLDQLKDALSQTQQSFKQLSGQNARDLWIADLAILKRELGLGLSQ
jgi:DNA gyrase/topoisomerase IV subunit A